MVALPVPVFVQPFASVTLVTFQVVVIDGLTVKVYGLAVIPFIVTGVVPSV